MDKRRLDAELKEAMLAGDREKATLIRGLKSAVLYEEVSLGLKDQGLDEAQLMGVLRREAKKRRESAELYDKGGDEARATKELEELRYIESLLPKAMDDDEVKAAVARAVEELHPSGPQDMGRVIGLVREKTAGRADGALIARLVKEAIAAR